MKRAITSLGTGWVLLSGGEGNGICDRQRSSSRARADAERVAEAFELLHRKGRRQLDPLLFIYQF